MPHCSAIVLLAATCLLAACTPQRDDRPRTAADSQQAHIREVVAAGGVVDSILPIAEHVRRFVATLPERPDTLRHASASREALVRRWVEAAAERDTAALNAMVVDRAEFALLYYPDSRMAKPPYEAPPELLWGQMLAGSDAGARRVFDRFGGRPLSLGKLVCAEPVGVEGQNRLHGKCMTTLVRGGVALPPMELFGTIIERDGRFKFLGYANRI